MSMESDLFRKFRPDYDRMEEYGFIPGEGGYRYIRNFLDEEFRAEIFIPDEEPWNSEHIKAKVIETDTGMEYLPIRNPDQAGVFVSEVRTAYLDILEEIAENCFISMPFAGNQANRIALSVLKNYGDHPDYPWESYPDYAVFRNPANQKWYALVAEVGYNKLRKKENSTEKKSSSKLAEIINVKVSPEKVEQLVQKEGIYTAYHMNKKNWITVTLDDKLSDREILDLLEESHAFTEKKGTGKRTKEIHTWVVPAHPKYYDIVGAFEQTDVIQWKQSSKVHVGDIIYMYVGAPYSAILYKCRALKTDIPYTKGNTDINITTVMEIKRLETYDKTWMTLNIMRSEYGVNTVRGPRSMPEAIEKRLDELYQNTKTEGSEKL